MEPDRDLNKETNKADHSEGSVSHVPSNARKEVRRMYESGCKRLDFIKAGYKIWNLAKDLTPKEMLECGFSFRDIMPHYSYEDMYKDGIPIRQLTKIGFNIEDNGRGDFSLQSVVPFFSIKQLHNAGYSAHEFKELDYDVVSLRSGGYNAKELREAGYPDSQVMDAGYEVKDLMDAGYSLVDFKNNDYEITKLNDYFSPNELKDANYSDEEILHAGYSAKELKEAGYSSNDVRYTDIYVRLKKGINSTVTDESGYSSTMMCKAGFSIEELRKAGYDYNEILYAGYLIKELRESGFKDDDILKANYSIEDLKIAGFTDDEILHASRLGYELRNAGYSIKDLKDAGYGDIAILQSGYTVKEMRDAGYSAKELADSCYNYDLYDEFQYDDCADHYEDRYSGYLYHPNEMKEAGYSVKELKEAGYKDSDIIHFGGYPASELKDAGYTVKDLRIVHNINEADYGDFGITYCHYEEIVYPLGKIIKAGYTLKEIVSADIPGGEYRQFGITIQDLKKAGCDPKLLIVDNEKYPGFSIREMIDGGYTISDLKNVFCIEQMADDGITIRELINGGCSFSELEKAYGIEQIQGEGYSAKELFEGGISFLQIAEVYPIEELQEIVSYYRDMKNSGSGISDLIGKGADESILWLLGFKKEEIEQSLGWLRGSFAEYIVAVLVEKWVDDQELLKIGCSKESIDKALIAIEKKEHDSYYDSSRGNAYTDYLEEEMRETMDGSDTEYSDIIERQIDENCEDDN